MPDDGLGHCLQIPIGLHTHIGRQNPPRWWEPEIHPRSPGPFIRASGGGRELVLGQWALIPHFAKTAKLSYQTNNARAKASFRQPWLRGQRCLIPAASFDEPCWETGRISGGGFGGRTARPGGSQACSTCGQTPPRAKSSRATRC
ncbi:SOS response-associated peptidase family protein [Castellaniella sp.]|uniref:SOS response-associated peptidase family protein n=1 Tax=Castellaniella sp. TaxID=1955812 RepID=UPI002AFEEF1D|nr:SOS response-associated peptidase family protein [Castellaniella sp.]